MQKSHTSQSGNGDSNSGMNNKKDNEGQDFSIFIIIRAVFLYTMVTKVVSWIGLTGRLGGGIRIIHREDRCWDITYCIISSDIQFVTIAINNSDSSVPEFVRR